MNTTHKKCHDCNRDATVYTFIRSSDVGIIHYKCGYHTWWFGTHAEPEYKQRLNKEFALRK